jgi:hypothetical protein
MHHRFAFAMPSGIQRLITAIQDNPVDYRIVAGTRRGQRLVRAGIIVDDEYSRKRLRCWPPLTRLQTG